MSPRRSCTLAGVEWVFHLEDGRLLWPDPGPARRELKEALEDCVPSLSPAGAEPQLSPYWIDHALSGLSSGESADTVIASGNAWSLIRSGDDVRIHLDYGDEDDEDPTVRVVELVAGLTAYREAVVRAIEDGHKLDGRMVGTEEPAGLSGLARETRPLGQRCSYVNEGSLLSVV